METTNQLEPELIMKEDRELLASLHPHPAAERVSRKRMLLIAAERRDEDMVHVAMKSDSRTIYWQIDGEFVEQQISVKELPAS